MATYKYYLSCAWCEKKGKYLAVITEGHPKDGDDEIKVCALELFDDKEDARPWFDRQIKERPWLPRN